MIAVVRSGVGERPDWAPLWIAWGCHVGWSSVCAPRVADACYVPPGPLDHQGPLALLPGGPVWAGWPPGTLGPGRPDVVSDQGLLDTKGRPVVPPPMQPVVWGMGPHVCRKAGG